MNDRFDRCLTATLAEAKRREAAVAVVQKGRRWLLGLSNSEDDRRWRWCAPGGGVKPGESIRAAAARECWEETGVRCRPVGEPFRDGKEGVWFVHCRADGGKPRFEPNDEFLAVGFFDKEQMRKLDLYGNVRRLIAKVEKCKS